MYMNEAEKNTAMAETPCDSVRHHTYVSELFWHLTAAIFLIKYFTSTTSNHNIKMIANKKREHITYKF